MIYPASEREQRVFTYWLEKRVYAKRQMTATAFLRLCNEGKVPGLEPESDTVSGPSPDAGDGERRDGAYSTPIPGNATARPGPSTPSMQHG